MAALWSIPSLFVVENNRIAQTTPIDLNLAGEISKRFDAFGIDTEKIDSSDVIEINNITNQLIERIKNEGAPRAFVVDTYRFGPHSKGDDTRSEQYIQDIRKQRDPIDIHAKRIDAGLQIEIDQDVTTEIKKAFEAAIEDPLPEEG
jgi:TPP-dependent pyruvate/acetoin dehydrogenase alpha subunit